jgi:hypothetical protein
MLDVESSFDNNWTEIASNATCHIARVVAHSPVSLVMAGANNPLRKRLLRDMRKLLKRHNGTCTLFVTLTTKSAEVGLAKPNYGALYQYELNFQQGMLRTIEHAAAVYNG